MPDTILYETLQLQKTATEAEINKAYYKLAKKHHPGNNPDQMNIEMFKKINFAYFVLVDENNRAIYDNYGLRGLKGEGTSSPLFPLLPETFEDGIYDLFLRVQEFKKGYKRMEKATDEENYGAAFSEFEKLIKQLCNFYNSRIKEY